MTKIKPKEITIERVEGYVHECIKRTVHTWDEANAMLRRWSNTAPKDGCYDKCDFLIVFEDGDTYEGRYDLEHWSVESPCLERHVGDFVRYLAGTPPRWLTVLGKERELARYHQRLAEKPERVEEAKKWLETYDLNERVLPSEVTA